ncbi:MAG: hypothetical protein ACXWPM_10500 [Bdellovibrionota bacterium]
MNKNPDPNCQPTVCQGDTVIDGPKDVMLYSGHADQTISCSQVSACFYGKEYLSLVSAVQADTSNSMAQYSGIKDVNTNDYSDALSALGKALTQTTSQLVEKSQFTLTRVPAGNFTVQLTIQHADGSSDVIPAGDFTVAGNVVTVTMPGFPGNLLTTDQLLVSYLPVTVMN